MSGKNHFFYDSANAANIASGLQAAVYINGFAWSKHDIDRMSAVFRVSVKREAEYAKQARCIDVETDAGEPEDVPGFVTIRRERHHGSPEKDDATAYVNRSNWRTVAQIVFDAGLEQPLYWVATLDGTTEVEPIEVGGKLIHAWAVQFFGGPTTAFDKSIIHGIYNLHKP